MMIRQEFSELPPKPFLMQVLDTTSKIYTFLWDRKDDLQKISMSWKDLSRYFNKNTFRTSLRKLNDKGLLDYEETEEGISVELVDWNSALYD